MKTRRLSIFLFFIGFGAGNAAAAELGPGYKYWSSYKPGTTVSFRSVATGSGSDLNTVLTVSVKSVDPDRAVLVFKESSSLGPNASAPGSGASIEFKASAFAREKEDLFHDMLPVNIAREIAESEAVIETKARLSASGHAANSRSMRVRILRHSVRAYGMTLPRLISCSSSPKEEAR